jgi:GcrA cell cycle regulator
MSWTEERVERLSTMWLEGRSASQIAAELGEGVSRNAVIGKVHRLGLSGRAVPPAGDGAPLRTRRDGATAPSEDAAVHAIDDIAAVIDSAPEPITFDLPALRAAAPSLRAAKAGALPISDRVTILELSGSMCRWPIGDPTSADFRFCGCRAVGTLPYCQDHARVAFQPVADRRRTERMVRIA